MSYTNTSTVSTVILACLLGAAACNAKPTADRAEKAEKEETVEKKVAQSDPSTLITGDKPTIPAVFKGLEPGMPLAAAKAKLPSLPEGSTIEDPAYGDMRFFVYVPKDAPSVKNVRFQLPKDKALALVKAKWGEPVLGEDIGKPVHYWYNPEKKLSASLKEGYGEGMDLTLIRYEPMAQLLGEGKEIAFLSKVAVLGATPDQLKAGYSEWFHAESASEAKAKKAAIDKLTEGKTAALTTEKPSAYLDFPPTEYGGEFMRVNLSWSDEGKVESYRFYFSYRHVKAKKDEIFAMFVKKWGEPKKQEKYGRERFVFSKAPFIVVEPNTISDQWDVKVQAKAD